ncbi:chemotaxis response regulator [Methanosarcina acetivorans C2A]|uniref:Chemotaxis response regulator n=2 Tax=Methanosarcina acetivorans TaxID=2214 RepID=Q8TUP9_METAC|nr:chemotaxis response regulator [Methanosarcina acetivorans C2A]
MLSKNKEGKSMARVMIVDDAEFMRMVIRDILLKHGHEVVAEVGDGEEAIQTYLEVKPDLVLMDIIMPDMDGKEALQKLLLIDPDAKVVMCSSLGQQALITESMKIGAMGFIIKPFEPDGMLDVIKKIAEPN